MRYKPNPKELKSISYGGNQPRSLQRGADYFNPDSQNLEKMGAKQLQDIASSQGFLPLSGGTMTGTLTMGDNNIVAGTTTGIQIGTSSTSKLGLYDATPVIRQNHIVHPDGTLADATTKINSILVALETVGIIKTS